MAFGSALAQLDSRLDRIDRHLEELARIERRYPWARLGVFLAGLAGTLVAFTSTPEPWGWLALVLFLGVFAFVAALHRRVLTSIQRFTILRRLTVEQRARLTLDWGGIRQPPAISPIQNHPFELDLNITGERSLHRLLDTAASGGGSLRLRNWLLELRPDLAHTHRRQALVRSLIPRFGFRNRLSLASALVMDDPRERWDGEKLLVWLEKGQLSRRFARLLAVMGVVSLANIILLILNLTGALPALWIFGVILFWGLQGMAYRETIELFSEAYGLGRSLELFRAVLAELESYPYPPGDPLTELCRPFWHTDQRPSRSLRRLSWIVTAASLRSNPFLGLLLNTLLPWDMFFTYLLDRYKRDLRARLPAWLDTWYELEGLNSLANAAKLNPQPVFPSVIPLQEAGDGEIFSARGIAHPLLPAGSRVSNDFAIRRLGELFIITGSNMSGKSTFLRTLGVNLCLAYAGGTVWAESLCVVPFRLFTSINVSDSLSDGISYFYAEVRRLKALLDALDLPDEPPLFFLIDEIFRGTNNRERQVGSHAYTQALVGKNGAGLISTHDLELVHLADEIGGVSNYHFREDVQGGRMVFDFRLRPGPSPTTNALKIMALEGLPTTPRNPAARP